MFSQNFTLQAILERERLMIISKFPSWDIDLVDLLFGNPMNVVTIRFGELCSNISVGGYWDLILDPMIFRGCYLRHT